MNFFGLVNAIEHGNGIITSRIHGGQIQRVRGQRDVDIAYFGTILALWSLYVPENMF